MDEARQAATVLAQLGDTADAVAHALKAKDIQGVRHTVRFLNLLVRYLQSEITGTYDMNLIKGDQLSITLRDGRHFDVLLPSAAKDFLAAFNNGARADMELQRSDPTH
jgi:hypothetical protein